MNKIIKSIFIFYMFFLVIFGFNKAEASTLSLDNLNYYFTFINNNNKNFSDEASIYYIDGIPSYCIEPGVKLGSVYDTEGSLDHLDNNIKNRILEYMYYGYLYKNHTDKNYYMATQALIWEELLPGNQEVVFSTQLFKKGNIIDLSSYKNEIINTINSHKGSVYGSGKSYPLLHGETLTIEDTSGVYDDYRIEYDNNLFDIKKEDNKLTIYNTKGIATTDITLIPNNMYDRSYKVMHSDDKQDLLVIGNIPLNPLYINLNIYGGSLVIIKQDENKTKLPGVKFNLYDNEDNYITTIKISSNGEGYYINMLKKGIYYIKEIETVPGYDLDEEKKYIEVTSSNNYIRIKVINHKVNADLVITKKDKDTNEVISDTTIGIYDSDMNILDSLITDENGKVSVNLGYGKYYYKELVSNPLYELDDTLYEVMIDSSAIYERDLFNNKIVEKVIEEPEEPTLEELSNEVDNQEDELIIYDVPNTYKISIIPLLCLIGAVIIEEKYT